MTNEPNWGCWRSWNAETAMGPPPDASPGTLIEADLIIRTDWIFRTDRPTIVNGYQFEVVASECFALNPLGQPQPVATSHLVMRYRIWYGIPEEELLQLTQDLVTNHA